MLCNRLLDENYTRNHMMDRSSDLAVDRQENRPTSNLQWKHSLRQIIACVIAHSISIPAGINLAFSAILLPQLHNSGDIHITTSEASWIASLVTISLPIGTVLIGVLMDRFGRKKGCMLTTIFFAIAWIVTGTAKNVWTIYCGRLLAGFASGLTTVSVVYICEVTHPNFRPMLLGLTSVYVSLGILLTCVLGYWCNWRVMCYVYLFLEVIIFVFLFFIPESPYWLVIFRNDKSNAVKSLRWLYKEAEAYNNESHQLLTTDLKQDSEIPPQEEFNLFKLRCYRSPAVYKPFAILALLFIIQQLTGAYVIIFYAVDIFVSIVGESKTAVNEYVALLILGVIRFVASVISALVSKRIGRRSLMFISGVGMCISSLTAGLYIQLNEGKVGYDQNVPIICLLSYVSFGSVGYLLIPWTLIGELLPVRVRGKLGSFLIGLAYVYMFGVVKVFPFIIDSVKLQFIFCTFAIVNVVGVGFVYYFLPETLGKRFSEIEKEFL
ncbi:hypothetical protein FQA39_LY07827 [Lamprigera yunnana]|nr:hypothetical protein FQA39_LY07827 [Lamprigera yunnana]